jgi:hypothetical protein
MKKFQDANKKQKYYKFSHLGFKQQQQQQQQQKVRFLSTMALSETSSPVTPKLQYTLHIFQFQNKSGCPDSISIDLRS